MVSSTDVVPTQTPALRAAWCVFYASGVIGSLIIYGLLQERVMTLSYDDALFTFSVFLVLMNRLAAAVFGAGMAAAGGESLKPNAPLWKYAIISFSNVAASTCQYEALKYVSFAVQMLGKSFKMMPVMLWGMAISGKRYGIQDWFVAAAVTLGVTDFLMTGPTASPGAQGSSARGFLLLLAFLAFDGMTSTMQEKLFKEHATTKYNQMTYLNGISGLTSLFALVLAGSFLPASNFFLSHPAFAMDAMVLSASAVTGQWFILSQVKEFGALVYAATMNVRQIASIIVSYMTYGHAITALQVFGLLITSGALCYKSFSGLLSSPAQEKTPLLAQKTPAEKV